MRQILAAFVLVCTVIGTAAETLPVITGKPLKGTFNKIRISQWYAGLAQFVLFVSGSNLAYAALHDGDAELDFKYEIFDQGGNIHYYAYQGKRGVFKTHDKISMKIDGIHYNAIIVSSELKSTNSEYSKFKIVARVDFNGFEYRSTHEKYIRTDDKRRGKILTTHAPVESIMYGSVCEIKRC